MKVILTKTVPKVGKELTVVNVKGGFARNYLFPRGLAIVADKNQLKALETRHQRMAAKLAETKTSAEALKEKLAGLSLKVEGKVAEGSTKLFGAITAQDVADLIKKEKGIELDKKQVGILEPIRRLGLHKIELDLHRDVDLTIDLNVFDPNAPVEEPPQPEVLAAEAEVPAPAPEEEEKEPINA